MNAHLPAELEQFVKAKVQSGRFSSWDEAIAEAVRLLREREESEDAGMLEGIRRGLDDMRAGRGRPADEVLSEFRCDLNLTSKA
jgi:putative addiction module CopG family antidote